jgi:Ca-activated chloride channel family protein
MRAAVDMCQRTNTSIYAFRAEPEPGMFSAGAKVLADLTAQTGGRVFRDNDSEAGIYEDLQTIEEDMRNQYRLVYQPAGLVRDGAFHRIELTAPERAQTIVVRSGYYAPTR